VAESSGGTGRVLAAAASRCRERALLRAPPWWPRVLPPAPFLPGFLTALPVLRGFLTPAPLFWWLPHHRPSLGEVLLVYDVILVVQGVLSFI